LTSLESASGTKSAPDSNAKKKPTTTNSGF